ncbi:hypothetical protein DSO57_1004209 [Entomophthora muscae]|uniref:Uncharacterized protein n=1 Tax=Entomophthora muscae TaxID=34485 RepID=A0ACC2RN10_9FUNG|nr:hypothetical protein DSO57_1004209 [Entomophthora muscae]
MIPYSLTGHIHEREAGRHLKTPVYFSPHVASFFRGITLTISVPLPAGVDFTSQSLLDLYSSTYSQHRLNRCPRRGTVGQGQSKPSRCPCRRISRWPKMDPELFWWPP